MASAALRFAGLSTLVLLGCAVTYKSTRSTEATAIQAVPSEKASTPIGEIRFMQRNVDSNNSAEWEIIPVKTGELSLRIYDEFGTEVHSSRKHAKESVRGRFGWDGKNMDGGIVAAGPYYLAVKLVSDKDTADYDPRWTTGGETVIADSVSTKVLDGEVFEVQFSVRRPSLLNAYFGLLGGVTLHQPIIMEPYPSGRHVFQWRSKGGQDGLDFSGFRNLIHGVSGYALPENAFIVRNGNPADYRAKASQSPPVSRLLRPVATQARFSVSDMMPPVLSMEILNPKGKTSDGTAIVSGIVKVKLIMNDVDRLRITRQRFETMFFSDLFGVFEDEDASLPFTYEWDVSRYNPGKHFLTCNITTYAVAHAASTVLVMIDKNEDVK